VRAGECAGGVEADGTAEIASLGSLSSGDGACAVGADESTEAPVAVPRAVAECSPTQVASSTTAPSDARRTTRPIAEACVAAHSRATERECKGRLSREECRVTSCRVRPHRAKHQHARARKRHAGYFSDALGTLLILRVAVLRCRRVDWAGTLAAILYGARPAFLAAFTMRWSLEKSSKAVMSKATVALASVAIVKLVFFGSRSRCTCGRCVRIAAASRDLLNPRSNIANSSLATICFFIANDSNSSRSPSSSNSDSCDDPIFLRFMTREAGRETIYDAVHVLAEKKIINPPKNWLETLRWDGVRRVDNWLAN
jgi:hypothetical protein